MIDMSVSVSGQFTAAAGIPPDAIRRAMKIIGLELRNDAVINSDKPLPGHPHLRTGRLKTSITEQVSPDGFSVVVGASAEYAPRLEMGYSGVESVRSHSRTITQAWGRSIAPREVSVRSFDRNANTPAYPFLRPAVDDAIRKGWIVKILQREIDKAVNSA